MLKYTYYKTCLSFAEYMKRLGFLMFYNLIIHKILEMQTTQIL